ncbi:MAG TPA: hypothetical protein VIT42_19050 [Microlunatus sp.]
MLVTADLNFQVDVPGGSAGPTRCVGRVNADGQVVTVEFDPMPSLGGSFARPLVRPLANQLHRLGLTVVVVGPDGPLVRVGAQALAPKWQRLLTRGLHVELMSVRALARSVGGPKVFAAALPPAAVLPALTKRQRSPLSRVSVAVRQVIRRVTGNCR